MKNRTMNIFNKLSSLLLLLLITGAMISCDNILDQFSELPNDEDDGAVNKNDPCNENFVLPNLRFTNSSYSFDSPFEVNQRELTLEWDVVSSEGTTLNFDYNYEFRYAAPGESIANANWQSINESESVTIPNLNETFNGENYAFEIFAEYIPNGNCGVKNETFTGQFSVNAIQSRGFLFNPYQISSNNDGTYTAEIYLDEIQESDDLTAFSLVLNYDDALLTVTDVQVFGETGSFLNPDGSNTLVYVQPEINSNFITIEAGIAGNSASISGGGAVCEITFAPTGSFQGNTSLSIHNTSVLKSSQGFDIDILQFDQAEVIQ
ncbi:MAG: hypothetical protein JJ953_07600 [Gracilimonas sp.]|uniref:hypothetical protein n=1 Tax=Gracilimonas TaxID=649462 RepID=UPI001B1EECFE|nr:hypothetical protein [Gracilimonas sp.]MBO6585949.1 hypothetical protein [Gracilimonas sp.]MBO6616946.1 hypothetical protein [Gracilimonas sp.]